MCGSGWLPLPRQSDVSVTIIHGDMRDVLGKMIAEGKTVQAVVTDPPYGLEFMGKEWDAPWQVSSKSALFGDRKTKMPGWGTTRNPNCQTCGGRLRGPKKCGCATPNWDEAPNATMRRQMAGFQDWFQECAELMLAVLPPGGHLLVFGGTRTYHRMAVAIEEAGFEIRDTIAWLYGSGFPKSKNVSKAIDKEAGAEREVIGQARTFKGDSGPQTYAALGEFHQSKFVDITAPATDAARQWHGWGTALKPSLELVCVARKPLIGTVAANVLKYGTGALNIDGCRITTGQRPDEDAAWDNDQSLCDLCAERAAQNGKPSALATRAFIATSDAALTLNGKGEPRPAVTDKADIGCSDGTMAATTATSSSIDGSGPSDMDLFQQATTSTTSTATSPTTDLKTCNACRVPLTSQNTASSIQHNKNGLQQPQSDGASLGRWPANTCHDGSDEVVRAFPETNGSGSVRGTEPSECHSGVYSGPRGRVPFEAHAGSGSAARFFYSAKADADDRLGSKHPTIKPVDLMRWLVRLITPPGGTVLDPFAGSGATGMACMAEGIDCILVEREAEYVADIKARIAHVHGEDTPLFSGVMT
jgi:DNA modification methylase